MIAAMTIHEGECLPEVSLFLASAVHHMKNSIAVLIDGLERVLDQVSPAAFPAYHDVAQMMYETKRIHSNLIQLLTLYKVGENRYPFDPLPQSIDDFMLTLVAQQQPMLRSQGITLALDCDEELYWQFDEDLVSGVIGHALNNAIHYTRDKIFLSAKVVDEVLEIRVEDNGFGFPAHMLQEGINAMHGVDFQGGSTGLGLYFSAMVAKIHQRHGRAGAIYIANGGIHGGGCFILQLP